MKHSQFNSLEFQDFQAIAGLARFEAVGVVETLHQLTAANAPRGDLGRHSDATLARALGMDAHRFEAIMGALLESGLVLACPTHRFIVANWDEHAPDYITKRLSRAGESIITSPDVQTTAASVRPTADNGGQRQTVASDGGLTKGREGKGREGNTSLSDADAPDEPTAEDEPEAVDGKRLVWDASPPKARTRSSRKKLGQAWNTAKIRPEEVPRILRGLEIAKQSHDWQKQGGEFIPAIDRWVRDRRFESLTEEDSRITTTTGATKLWS